MASPLDFNSMLPSQKFAQFIGEITSVTGNIISALETYTIEKIEEAVIDNDGLKALFKKVKENSDKIAYALFIVGCVYNFYTSPILFFMGLGLGALASAAPFPVEIRSLQSGELLGHTYKENYAAPKVIFSLAALNFYLRKTVLDNMAISIFSGLLAGNAFYHTFKMSAAGHGIALTGEKLAALTELALQKLPFYNLDKI